MNCKFKLIKLFANLLGLSIFTTTVNLIYDCKHQASVWSQDNKPIISKDTTSCN